MSRPADPRAIADPELVRLLASPVRQELVDTLAALGGMASVATLAEQLGRPADGLYHHMRLLAAAGLVDAMEADTGGERRYRLVGDGSPIRLAYRQGPDGNTDALSQFARALLHVARSDFDAAVDRPGVALAGPQRQLWASRTTGWLSDDDLVEVNRLLERLGAMLSQPKSEERSRLMSLAFALAPLHPRPKRRD
ncbi:MAG: helix-turn-helix domain-containing protein [Sphingomonadaceae bacterium]|nr:helix-turn-helix domain-containing protein [Sphingomonadaceae bacterium]